MGEKLPDPRVDEGLALVVEAIGGQPRVGQLAMANAVLRAITGSGHLLVQAGTGTGKSLGYLVPAALFAAKNDQSIVVATATLALQKQLIDRDLPTIAEALEPSLNRPMTYAVLKGRNNYVCLQKLHGTVPEDESAALFSTARGPLGDQVIAVRAWAEGTSTGDRDEYPDDIDPRVWRSISVGRRECIGESRCEFGDECFTAKRRVAAAEADIVITNHAMLAIDALEGVPVLPEHAAVIIDEGHELVDRATAAVTGELTMPMVEKAISRSRRLVSPEVLEAMQEAAESLDDALNLVAGEASGPVRLDPIPADLDAALNLLRNAFHGAMTVVNLDKDANDPDALAARQQARGALEEVHDGCGELINAGDLDVVWLDPGDNRAPSLKMAPLTVAGLLRESLFDRSPVIMTSATLTIGGGFESLVASLGLTQEEVTTLDVGSPFDHAKQGILYVAADLPAPGREGVAMEALDELAALIEAAGGSTLALFSSWRGVERAADFLRVRLDTKAIPLLVQRKGDSVGNLVEKFAADVPSVLLGTVSLWQGVDVPGSSCVCVVIDRIPFPRPDDPLMSARQQAIDVAGGSGFLSVAVARAGLLLAQGAGRLIRGMDDRGVVAVLDSRLATAGYARVLRASLPPFWYTTDRVTAIGALNRLRDGEDSASVKSDEGH